MVYWKHFTSILLVTLTAVVLSAPLEWHWNEWKQKHGRFYNEELEEHRRNIWSENFQYIKEHNRQNHPFKLKLNGFADMV